MKTKTNVLGFIILALLAGCFYGDRLPQRQSVCVTLESTAQQHTNAPSAGGEFQDALKIIDTVLTSRGFVRDREPVDGSGQGLVASYARHQGTDRLLGGPAIQVQANALKIVFGAEGGMNSRLSQSTINVIGLLRDDLARRYGAEAVTVGR
jgi:hypothetical protein